MSDYNDPKPAPVPKKPKQDRGQRNNLNTRKVKDYLAEIDLILFGNKKKGIAAQDLTHKERLSYLATAAKFARLLNERDKARYAAKKAHSIFS
jgi:hypothetical protein